MEAPQSQQPVQCVVYGKTIIDDIRLRDGTLVRSVLGGGGPQAAFGARLWSDSIGFLSRAGEEIEPEHEAALLGLDLDLRGWVRFPGIPTPRNLMQYDEHEYMSGGGLTTGLENWNRLLSNPLTLPPGYDRPRAIHLITEYPDEPMVATARELRSRGAALSLEPLISDSPWGDRPGLVALLKHVDLVTPDWPSASSIANSDDPTQVVSYWSRLGPKAIAIRHGRHGSYVWSRESDQAWHVPPVPVDVVDPTGAGNAYGGGFCVGWTETRDVVCAGCYGTISAALLLGRYGLPRMSPALSAEARALVERTLARARRI